jgi:hypothetical protein
MFFCILFNYTILRDTKVRFGCVPMPAAPDHPSRENVQLPKSSSSGSITLVITSWAQPSCQWVSRNLL